MRRHVGRHTDGDTGAAVDEQVRKCGREYCWLGARFVVVRDKIDSIFVHVIHQRGTEVRHARFGITHGGRWIAFDGTEIALAIDQSFAHRPGLGHVDERRVNDRFTVRMVVTAGVTANLRAFTMLPVREQGEIVHRVENAALRRFQTIARIGQRAGNDDGHRVVEERVLDFVRDVDFLDFFISRIKRGSTETGWLLGRWCLFVIVRHGGKISIQPIDTL